MSDILSDAELAELWSFWMWDPLKEKWDFIRDWEEHKVEAMRKFEEYVFGRGGAVPWVKKGRGTFHSPDGLKTSHRMICIPYGRRAVGEQCRRL